MSVLMYHLTDLRDRFLTYGRVIGVGMVGATIGLLVACLGSPTIAAIAVLIYAVGWGAPSLIYAVMGAPPVAQPAEGEVLAGSLRVGDSWRSYGSKRNNELEIAMLRDGPAWLRPAILFFIPRYLRDDIRMNLGEVYDYWLQAFGRRRANTILAVQFLQIAVWAVHARFFEAISRLLARLLF